METLHLKGSTTEKSIALGTKFIAPHTKLTALDTKVALGTQKTAPAPG